MKKSENSKIGFLNKKLKKVLNVKKFSPGSIVQYMSADQNIGKRYLYLDKDNFEILDGNDWFKKNEMEFMLNLTILTEFENEIIKQNYENSFYFYDNQDKLKYNQVIENITYILN